MGLVNLIFGNSDKKENRKIEHLKGLVKDLQAKLAVDFNKAVIRIKELDPNKIYLLVVDSKEDVDQSIDMLNLVQAETPWKIPRFIVATLPAEELNKKELKALLKEVDKNE